MNESDVDGNDMFRPHLSDEQLAALLDGHSEDLLDHPVADAIGRIRASLESEPTPAAGAALSEFLVGHVNPATRSLDAAATTLAVDVLDEPSPRRTPVLTTLSTFLGTLVGKLFIGTSIAAASVGAAHATGIVDIPGLPGDDTAVVEVIDDDSETTTTTVVPSTTSTTVPNPTVTVQPFSPSTSTTSTTTIPSTTTAPTSTDSATTVPSTTTPSTTVPSTSTSLSPGAQQFSYSVPGVGTTSVEWTGTRLVLVSATPTAGWVLDQAGPDLNGVESKYTQGSLETRIDFEVDSGQVRVRIRTRNDNTDERTERFEYFPFA